MKKIPYNITEKYVKSKYNESGKSIEEGYNCLGLVVDFCKQELDLDYKFEDKITGDISWKNVSKVFHDNPEEVFKQVERYFTNYFDVIAPHQMRKGDVVSVNVGPDGIKIPCVYAGNDKILLTTKKGIKVVSLKGKQIFDCYRVKEKKKITTKAVYKLNEITDKLDLVEEESYIYEGDIAECWAGATAAAVFELIVAVISLIMAVWSYYNMPDTPGDSQYGTQLNTRAAKEPQKVVYGTQKVGGNDVYMSTFNQFYKDLYIIQTLAEGEIESVEEVFIDDHPLSYFVHWSGTKADYQFYNGSPTQTYDTTINNLDPAFTDNMRNTAYIRWHFRWNSDIMTGLPTRLSIIKGKKLYDFRDETTAWSDNGVLALYDMLTNRRYGLAVDATAYIDITSWTAAANYFDDKGWSFNFITNGSNNPWTTIQNMMKHFRANISWFDGKYYLLISDLNIESSVMTIEDKHIVQGSDGKAQIKLVKPSRFNKPNGLKCTFIDKDKSYTRDELLVGEATGVIQTIDFFGFTDRDTVGKMANYQLERLRLDRSISGTFRDDCLELAPHDLVTFNSTALGIADQPMRVVSTGFAGNGLINLSLQYEAEELYDDIYTANIEGTYTCNLPRTDNIPLIANPQITEETYFYGLRTESRLHVTFTVPEDEDWFEYCEVWQAIISQGDAVPADSDYEHQFNTTNYFNIDQAEQGKLYYIVLVPVSLYGVKERFSNAPKLSHVVAGNSSAPESLAFLSAIPSSNSVTLYSNKLDDPDIEIYEFRLGSQWNGGIFLSAKRSPNEQLPGVKPGLHIFFCNTKGTNNLYGINPQSASATISTPVGWSLSKTYTDDYSDGTANVFINTEQTTYAVEDYLMCSHDIDSTTGDIVLTGSYESDVFDTGVIADEYYIYLEADIVLTGDGTLWDNVIPVDSTALMIYTKWSDIGISTRTWYEIFTIDEAPRVDITILYKKTLGEENWSEVKNAEILSSIVTARYVKVKIEIVDPSSEIYAKVEYFNLRLYTKT